MSALPVAKESPDGKYFHIMLNMSDDDLDVYEYRLLGHYVRVCNVNGTGQCWESTRTTADKCKMSVGKVSSTRKSLEAKGYLKLLQPDQHSKGDTLMVLVVDRWAENINRYSSQNEQPELKVIERSPHEQSCSHDEQECSPHETKNNNIRKTIEQDSTTPAPEAPQAPVPEKQKAVSSSSVQEKEPLNLNIVKIKEWLETAISGTMTLQTLELLKEDSLIYSLDQWREAIDTYTRQREAKLARGEGNIGNPYKYILGILKNLKQKQDDAKNAADLAAQKSIERTIRDYEETKRKEAEAIARAKALQESEGKGDNEPNKRAS